MKVTFENEEDVLAFDNIVKDLKAGAAKLIDQGQFDPAARLQGHAERLQDAAPKPKKKDDKEEKKETK